MTTKLTTQEAWDKATEETQVGNSFSAQSPDMRRKLQLFHDLLTGAETLDMKFQRLESELAGETRGTVHYEDRTAILLNIAEMGLRHGKFNSRALAILDAEDEKESNTP